MTNSLNPVFGNWYTDRQIGIGTDGKVFRIYKENFDGSRDYSILKIIRLGENRNETQSLVSDDVIITENDEEYYSKIIKDISDNVTTLMNSDKGKHFVKYQDIELRKASDGKGRLILLRLEEMRSLADLLKDISFTLEETVRLGISICKALVKCRSFNYFYPNLKPENILFDKNGVCKLGDFGTFCTIEPAKSSVAYMRTQHYMAPEFYKTGKFNCTIDTYSLGLILYMLTNRNRLPFTPEYPENMPINALNEAMQRRLEGAALPKPALANDDLYKIILKACAMQPNERYLTPKQMLSDLMSVLNEEPFETVKYDEVYSVSKPAAVADGDFISSLFADGVAVTEEHLEDVSSPVSLKEEISIPESASSINFYKKKATQGAKKSTRYAKLPEIKKPVKKDYTENRKLLILIALTVLFFIIFVISVSMQNDSGETATAVSGYITNALNSCILGGAVLNGC